MHYNVKNQILGLHNNGKISPHNKFNLKIYYSVYTTTITYDFQDYSR